MSNKKIKCLEIEQHPLRYRIDELLHESLDIEDSVELVNKEVVQVFGDMPYMFQCLLYVTKESILAYCGAGGENSRKEDRAHSIAEHPMIKKIVEYLREDMPISSIVNMINTDVRRLIISDKTLQRFAVKLKRAEVDVKGRAMLMAQDPDIQLTPPKEEDKPAYVVAMESMRIDMFDGRRSILYAHEQCMKQIYELTQIPSRTLSPAHHKVIQGYLKEAREGIVALGKMVGALDSDGVMDAGSMKLVEEITAKIYEVNAAIWKRIDPNMIPVFLELWKEKVVNNPDIQKRFSIPVPVISEKTDRFVSVGYKQIEGEVIEDAEKELVQLTG